MSAPCPVPVLLLAHRRPELTALVLQRVRAARPTRLLVSIDGPRPGHSLDRDAIAEVQGLAKAVDWPCEVSVRVGDTNLGCRWGPSAGLDWAFECVDRAIVLEDDCVADPTFFRYCAELLDRYAGDDRVMGIGGYRNEGPDLADGPSYGFSRYTATWGWATWANRWHDVDVAMSDWEQLRDTSWLSHQLTDPVVEAHWRRTFDAMTAGLDAWDYALQFALWRSGRFWVRPMTNLIQNVGFGADATHTVQDDNAASRPAASMGFPMCHPEAVGADPARDAHIEWTAHSGITTRRLHEAARRIASRRTTRRQGVIR